MALIKCPECSAEISDKAVSCPKCGYPIQSAPSKPQPQGDLDAMLKEILAREGKISAIKRHRERTGAGLAEAKKYVERLESGLPPGAAANPPSQGCLSMVVLVALIVGLGILVSMLRPFFR